MLTIIFCLLLIPVFGKLLWVAIKCAWGITKIFFTIIFLPLVLIGLLLKGFIFLAVIGLIGAGIAALLGGFSRVL